MMRAKIIAFMRGSSSQKVTKRQDLSSFLDL